jgi:hypothetical protein
MSWAIALEALNNAVQDAFHDVTVQRQGKPEFTAIFDAKAVLDDLIGTMPGETRSSFSGPVPILTVDSPLADTLEQGEILTINTVSYSVRDMLPERCAVR